MPGSNNYPSFLFWIIMSNIHAYTSPHSRYFVFSIKLITFYVTSPNFGIVNMIIALFLAKKTLQKEFDKNNIQITKQVCLQIGFNCQNEGLIELFC